MWPKVLALAVFLLGVGIGVVGGWVKPPATLSRRATLVIFAVLLAVAGGVTFFTAKATDDDKTERASTGPAEGPDAATVPTSTTVSVTTTSGTQTHDSPEPPAPPTTQEAGGAPNTPPAQSQPCIVGSWALTTIVDHVPYSDQTVTMSYDSGWEKRTYAADGTFSITNDWHERGYDDTLDELAVHSNGSAQGNYQLAGSTATYDPVSSIGNWTLTVNGDVRQQSSVIFSRGEESITCTPNSLDVASGSDYSASYTRA